MSQQMNLTGIPPIPSTPVAGSVAVVVFSGGQDSVTCLGWAKRHFETVHTLGFDYGQNHVIELQQARLIAEDHGVSFELLKVGVLGDLGDSALVTGGDVNEAHHRSADLPASFVPNRNALFLTVAHAYAQKMNAAHLITGVCQTDYSGYPDCRDKFIELMEVALNVGYETDIKIHTPLMYINKAQTFQLALDCGILGTVIKDTHTCYNGDRTLMHEWGAGCGECPACKLRAAGYARYLAGNFEDEVKS